MIYDMNDPENLMSFFPQLEFIFDEMMPDKQKGLYIDNTIYLNPRQTVAELYGTLSEEIGHYLTSAGDLSDQKSIETTKQEWRARFLGSIITVTPTKLIECQKEGLKTNWECAEYIGVTVQHFDQAMRLYKEKYGLYFEYDGYAFILDNSDALNIIQII